MTNDVRLGVVAELHEPFSELFSELEPLGRFMGFRQGKGAEVRPNGVFLNFRHVLHGQVIESFLRLFDAPLSRLYLEEFC